MSEKNNDLVSRIRVTILLENNVKIVYKCISFLVYELKVPVVKKIPLIWAEHNTSNIKFVVYTDYPCQRIPYMIAPANKLNAKHEKYINVPIIVYLTKADITFNIKLST